GFRGEREQLRIQVLFRVHVLRRRGAGDVGDRIITHADGSGVSSAGGRRPGQRREKRSAYSGLAVTGRRPRRKSRSPSSHGGRRKPKPSSSAGSSTVKPGPSVAISSTAPPGSWK